MPLDAPYVPGSREWWFDALLRDLRARSERYTLLEDYYEGRPPLPTVPGRAEATFQQILRKCRANWATLIVEATRERMVPVGFRTGATGDDPDDAEAWRIWQANSLDADAALVHRAMLSMSDAYVIVGGVDPEIGAPLITPEDPREVITAHDPRNRRRTVAALKVFVDEIAGIERAYLYLPGEVHRAVRRDYQGQPALTIEGFEWESSSALPAQVVPVVRFGNRMNLRGLSMGEFEDVTDDIDRINIMLLQRVVVAIMQAFRQRAIKGLPSALAKDATIDWNAIFNPGPDALWPLPEGAEMWESSGVDLTPLLESVKADVRDLAATTRTPMFYLFPDAANGSAEGASLQREGLIFKTSDRITQTSEPWEQVMSLAFRFSGDLERASRHDMEVIWQPPERFSLAERYDAASKAQAAGVPWRTVMTDVLQYSPQQVARMEAEREGDLLLAQPLPPELAV